MSSRAGLGREAERRPADVPGDEAGRHSRASSLRWPTSKRTCSRSIRPANWPCGVGFEDGGELVPDRRRGGRARPDLTRGSSPTANPSPRRRIARSASPGRASPELRQPRACRRRAGSSGTSRRGSSPARTRPRRGTRGRNPVAPRTSSTIARAAACQATVRRCPPVIRPESHTVPIDANTRGTSDHAATRGPKARRLSTKVARTTASYPITPPTTRVAAFTPKIHRRGHREQDRRRAHLRRAGEVPSPVAVRRVEERQAVDGEVAVEVDLGVQDERDADDGHPGHRGEQAEPGPSRGPRLRGRAVVLIHGRASRGDQAKKSATTQRKPGSSGTFSMASVSS